MSEWDFLWGLKGQALEDAMAFGIEQDDWDYLNYSVDDEDDEKYKNEINEQHRLALKAEWEELKKLRDSESISIDEFRRRKRALFPTGPNDHTLTMY